MASTYTKLIYHIVFSTRLRSHCLRGPWVEELYAYIGGIIRGVGGKVEQIGGHTDHLHICARLLPRQALSLVVGEIKTASSRWITNNNHVPAGFAWQTGFSGFTVSHSRVRDVVRYIENQEIHHLTRTYDEELRVLLDRHGMPDT